jgi:hypothetical protein
MSSTSEANKVRTDSIFMTTHRAKAFYVIALQKWL